jgi:enoyl-CoA hydratase/carnithine racemase
MPSSHLHIELRDAVAVMRLTRPLKRNALNDGLIADLQHAFDHLPPTVRAAVLHGEGDHFCAGLDLSELQERDAGQGMMHSRTWHRALDAMQFGP